MNTVSIILQVASAVILAVLTYDIFRRYQQHKGAHKHLLFWGAGLAMFAIASLCGAILDVTWNEFAFIGWFLFGVVLNAAWIGEGTLHLLFRRRWTDIVSIILVLASV